MSLQESSGSRRRTPTLPLAGVRKSRGCLRSSLLPDARLRAELNDWLVHKVRPMFEQRVLPVSEDVMFKWRLLVEDGRKAGHTFSQPDLIIAATALQQSDGGDAGYCRPRESAGATRYARRSKRVSSVFRGSIQSQRPRRVDAEQHGA